MVPAMARIISFALVAAVMLWAHGVRAQAPPAASALHPGYSFAAIEPGWRAEKRQIEHAPGGGRTVKDAAAGGRYFTEVRYRSVDSPLTSKVVCYFPSGRVFQETDSTMRNAPIPLGEVHIRAFRDDGAMQYYAHWKDGKCLEGFSIAADGATERVKDGRGSLAEPVDLGGRSRRWFANGGRGIAHVHQLTAGGEQIWLTDDWGQWTRASGESLAKRKGEMGWGDPQWTLGADGTVTQEFRSAPPPAGPKPSQAELRERFLGQRRDSS